MTPGTFGNGQSGYGLAFRDGTGKLSAAYFYIGSSAQKFVENWTNPTTFSAGLQYVSAPNSDFAHEFNRNPMWLGLQDDGTSLKFLWALDKNHPRVLYTATRTSFFTSGPTQVAIISRPSF